jgi:hypothetical protein
MVFGFPDAHPHIVPETRAIEDGDKRKNAMRVCL